MVIYEDKINKDSMKKAVNIALEIVNDLNEPLKTEGFKLILNKLLEKDFKSITTKPIIQKKSDEKTETNHIEPLDNLAKVCECSKDEIMNVIDFDKDNFVLLKKVKGKDTTEIVQNASLCLLTAWMKGKGKEWIKTRILTSALYNSGISNVDVGKKLRKKNEYIIIKGKKTGAMYRLTAIGWQKGIENLKSLIQN